MNVGKSIRVALAKKGMTQRQLAEQLGMLPTSLSQLASQQSCTGATLEKLARTLGMKASEFVALGED